MMGKCCTKESGLDRGMVLRCSEEDFGQVQLHYTDFGDECDVGCTTWAPIDPGVDGSATRFGGSQVLFVLALAFNF